MIREREYAALPGLPIACCCSSRFGLLIYAFVNGVDGPSPRYRRSGLSLALVLNAFLFDRPLRRQPERGPACCSSSATTRAPSRTPGPALGEPALHEEAHLAAHPQLRERAPEGQRQRRQSDRDRRGRRLAGGGHRGSGVRGGRLQQLRQGADRGGAPQPGDQLHVRRARRGADVAARQHRRGRRAPEEGDPGSPARAPASK